MEKLRTELSRLKQHLIQIEEDYTNELVEVQQREACLEQQLIKAKAEVEQLTHRLNNTGPLVAIRAQAEQALDERDQVLQRCSKLEDEVQRSQASLANLQLVIERMQKGKPFCSSPHTTGGIRGALWKANEKFGGSRTRRCNCNLVEPSARRSKCGEDRVASCCC